MKEMGSKRGNYISINDSSSLIDLHAVSKDCHSKLCQHCTAKENDDQTGNDLQLLQNAHQLALTSRDTIITMLQKQLQLVQHRYKRTLDDAQEFRLKYFIMIKKFGNLKKICEKYRQDHTLLIQEQRKDAEASIEIITTTENGTSDLNLQYQQPLNEVKYINENVHTEGASTMPGEPQVELIQICRACSQDSTLDLIMDRLHESSQKSEEDEEACEILIISKKKMITISSETAPNKLTLHNILAENRILKNELEASKAKIEKNIRINENLEIQELKSELEHINAKINNLCNHDIELHKKSIENYLLQSFIPVDSITENTSKKIQNVEQKVISENFQECLTNDAKEVGKVEAAVYGVKEAPNTVSLAISHDPCDLSEITEDLLFKESETKPNKTRERDTEISKLCLQLKQTEDTVKCLRSKVEEVTETNNKLSKELNYKDKLLMEKDVTIKKINQKLPKLAKGELEIPKVEVHDDVLKLEKELNDKIEEKDINILSPEVLNNGLQFSCSTCKQQSKENVNQQRLEKELDELSFIKDDESLESQTDNVSKVVQQCHARQTKLKCETFTNTKVNFQNILQCSLVTCEQILKKYQQIKSNKQVTSEDCENFEKACQNLINQLSCDGKLLNAVEFKYTEISQPQENVSKTNQETDGVKLYTKEVAGQYKPLCEIMLSFTDKEKEISTITKELHIQEENLVKLEEENNLLKTLLNEKKGAFRSDEKLLQELIYQQDNEKQLQHELTQNIEQTKKMELLNLQYILEKSKTLECHECVDQMYQEIVTLKTKLYKLLQNLECVILQIKNDVKNRTCDCISTDKVNKMISYIKIFCDSILQEPASNQNTIISGNNFPALPTCSTTLNCIPECSIVADSIRSTEELFIKRDYLVKRVKSIDEKLNISSWNSQTAVDNSVTNKSTKFSDADLQEFQFKRSFYVNNIDQINKKLKNYTN